MYLNANTINNYKLVYNDLVQPTFKSTQRIVASKTKFVIINSISIEINKSFETATRAFNLPCGANFNSKM